MNPALQDPSAHYGGLPSNSLPPQIFGNYTSDGTLMTPTLTSPVFTDDSNMFGYDDHDPNDPKRRRIAKACDACRRKKIRCDGRMPACSHCLNYKTECVFTHVEKKRNPPKGAKYIEGLENRLGRMEHLLKLSGLLSQDDEGSADLGVLEQKLAKQVGAVSSPFAYSEHSRSGSQLPESQRQSPSQNGTPNPTSKGTSPKGSRTEEKAVKEERDVEALSDMMCSLVTNNQGETRYIGSSSGFSIFSPQGMQWVNEKTGERSFERMIEAVSADDNKWYHWRPEVFEDIFERKVYKALPPRGECLSLLRDFFDNFNMMFPLFHEPTFMHLVDKEYSNQPFNGSGWWASLNVALAIAFRIRVMSNFEENGTDSNAWGYFKNALAVQAELTLKNQDLLSVQALLGMALFLQGTPNSQPSYFFLAAAIRLAHSVGLHKRNSGFALNNAEIEQRKRVFWIAYMVDRDVCLRSGRPPCQSDDDWNVDLPSEEPDDGVGTVPLPDGEGKCNIFRLNCRFAIIQSKVYTQLYSVKASKQTNGELLNTIGELDRELEEWKEDIPVAFQPIGDISVLPSPLVILVVVLHFAYYNCLTTIHRMSIHRGFWTSRLSDYAIQGRNTRPLNPRVFNSASVCVTAARESIKLIKYIPPGDYACVWLILYYPVSSLVTLFANILQSPMDPLAESDLQLMDLVVDFLSRIASEEQTGSIRRIYVVCKEFQRISRMTLSKVENEMSTRQKRKQEKEREKIRKNSARHSGDLKRPAESMLNSSTPSSNPAAEQTPMTQAYDLESMNSTPLQPLMYSNGYNEQVISGQNDMNTNWMPNFTGTNEPSIINTNPQMSNFSFGMPDMVAPDDNAFGMGAFPQPYIPQDLWSMPMSFEWEWADLSNMGMGNYPFNNNMGGAGGGGQQQQQQQQQQGGG